MRAITHSDFAGKPFFDMRPAGRMVTTWDEQHTYEGPIN